MSLKAKFFELNTFGQKAIRVSDLLPWAKQQEKILIGQYKIANKSMLQRIGGKITFCRQLVKELEGD